MLSLTALKRIIISRTDNIGDVVLTLPFIAQIKALHPNCQIIFLGRQYIKPLVDASPHVDEFIDWEAYDSSNNRAFRKALRALKADAIIHVHPKKAIAFAAWQARIPHRIGTSRRWYHRFTCNHRVTFSRKASDLHEAQLNMKLFDAFQLPTEFTQNDIIEKCELRVDPHIAENQKTLLEKGKFNLIVHPGTNGNTREWSTKNFVALVKALPQNQFQIYLTGSLKEAELFKDTLIKDLPEAINLMGKFNLTQLLSFISLSDGLLAGSTGPLHMAAAMGIHTLGLFPAAGTMSPNRWAPLGKRADFLVTDQPCPGCHNNHDCRCMQSIRVEHVKQHILAWSEVTA